METAKSIVSTLIAHVEQMTTNAREYLEANPRARVPSDHINFPGKIDHVTVVAFQIRKPVA